MKIYSSPEMTVIKVDDELMLSASGERSVVDMVADWFTPDGGVDQVSDF